MNETLQVILNRRSTRKYADIPVSREEKDTILQAAMRAPTAGNMMLYSILEIDDQALKDQLAVLCDHQSFIARSPLEGEPEARPGGLLSGLRKLFGRR